MRTRRYYQVRTAVRALFAIAVALMIVLAMGSFGGGSY